MAQIDLKCIECTREFYFSDDDQAWYASQGFSQPKRCFKCRQARKAEKEARAAQDAQDAATGKGGGR